MSVAPFELGASVRRAGVVGLGLIGGSVARDLVARGVRVLGYDASERERAAAASEGVAGLTVVATAEETAPAELVVVAVPVTTAPALLAELAPHLSRARLVIDVGSTKRTIVAAAASLGLAGRFVGCHPLAGDHRSGWRASRAALFVDAPVYLCAGPGTPADAVADAGRLWTALGARPEALDAAEHDRRMAWQSHLPQAAATALAVALHRAGIARASLGPGGRDTSRLAASSAGLWTAIASDNADGLCAALAAYERELATLRERLAGGDVEGVRRFFAAGQGWAGGREERSPTED